MKKWIDLFGFLSLNSLNSYSHRTPIGVPKGWGCFVLPTLRPAGTQQLLFLMVRYALLNSL